MSYFAGEGLGIRMTLKRQPALLGVALALWLGTAPTAWAVRMPLVLHVAAPSWCPVVCDRTGEHPGMAVDILRAIYEPLGYTLVYTLAPQTRAREDVRSGTMDMLIAISANDSADFIHPQQPLMMLDYGLYGLKKRHWPQADIAALRAYKLGTIAGYRYGTLDTWIAHHPGNLVEAVSGDDARNKNIRKLLAERIDLVIESDLVMTYTLREQELDDSITRIGGVTNQPVFVGFSAQSAKAAALANIFDTGIQRLQESGALAEIYRRYTLPMPAAQAPRASSRQERETPHV